MIGCIRVTKAAFHFQTGFLRRKYCVSFANIQLSVSKIASWFTKWHVGFQFRRPSFGMRKNR